MAQYSATWRSGLTSTATRHASTKREAFRIARERLSQDYLQGPPHVWVADPTGILIARFAAVYNGRLNKFRVEVAHQDPPQAFEITHRIDGRDISEACRTIAEAKQRAYALIQGSPFVQSVTVRQDGLRTFELWAGEDDGKGPIPVNTIPLAG